MMKMKKHERNEGKLSKIKQRPRLQDDEIKAPTLLVFGWVEVFVGSRGELARSGVFLVLEC